ncbi:MAG: hypothetical protein ACLFTW_15325 [Chitinispirillaceae bacterium]
MKASGPYIIDMHFRSGENHSNHLNDAKKAVARIVKVAYHNGFEEFNYRSIMEFMGSEHNPSVISGMNGAHYALSVSEKGRNTDVTA